MSVLRHLQRYFFSASSAFDLGVCRVLFFAGLLYQHRQLKAQAFAALDAIFWQPIPLFERTGLPMLDGSTLGLLGAIYRVALAAACVGLITPVATVIAALLGFYLIGLPHNFGKVHHSDAIIVFMLIAFALSRAGDAVSLDALWRKRRGASAAAPSGEYTWPIRFMWLAFVTVYFGAGVAKLQHSGLGWINPAGFRALLLSHHASREPLVDWGVALAAHPWLCGIAATGALMLELSSPIVLIHARARALLVPCIFAMQAGIFLVMGVSFSPFLLIIPFWIPWSALRDRLSLRRSQLRAAQPG